MPQLIPDGADAVRGNSDGETPGIDQPCHLRDANTPSWMRQWLRQGKTPPGYDVDHILPLSAGGFDDAVNMRLQLSKLHRVHHQFYRPWEWYLWHSRERSL